MISKFKKIVDNNHAATIQGRLVSIDEARIVCEVFSNLTEPFNNTFIKMPIDKIIEFSLTSSPSLKFDNAPSKKRFSITEYIDEVQSEKLLNTAYKTEIPSSSVELSTIDLPVVKVNSPHQHKLNEIIDIPIPTSKVKSSELIKDEFYQQLFEQLDILKSNSFLIDASMNSVEDKIEKLTESDLSIMKTFEKLTKYLEKNNSNNILRELNESMVSNQKFISEYHKTLFENQTVLIDNQLSLIETQKLITNAIETLNEKISSMSLYPQLSSPIINVNENVRNTVKVVERNEAGLITKIIESTITDDNDNK